MRQNVSIQEVLEVKKRNRLQIEIASPLLVIPFKRNNDIESECWIFNMGNINISNFEKQEGKAPFMSIEKIPHYNNY